MKRKRMNSQATIVLIDGQPAGRAPSCGKVRRLLFRVLSVCNVCEQYMLWLGDSLSAICKRVRIGLKQDGKTAAVH